MRPVLSRDLLEATRLTHEGRLSEATSVLQRMLAGGVAPRNSGSKAQHNPLTIDGMVESAEETPNQPARDAVQPSRPAGRHSFLDQVNCGKFKLPGRGLPYPSPSPERVAVPNGAQFLTSTFSGQTGSRPYKLYIPSGYRGHAVALVVMLHGCTQSPDDFAVGTRMNEAAEEHTCLVVYPGQTHSANSQKCWNWFREGDQQRDRGEPALIAGITREVIRRYAIDPQRIYVAGLSAGGAAAAVMGHAYPDLYAAVGVHSGLACGAARDMPSAFAAMQRGSDGSANRSTMQSEASRRVVPTIVFHGDGDTTVNPCNADAVVMQSARLAALRTQAEEGRVPHGHTYRRTMYVDANAQTLIEQWVVHGAGHAWFGGSSAGSYTDPRGPDATREMLRFFLAHPHPTARQVI